MCELCTFYSIGCIAPGKLNQVFDDVQGVCVPPLYLPSIMLNAEAAVWQAVVCQELGVLVEAALEVLVLSTDGVQLV